MKMYFKNYKVQRSDPRIFAIILIWLNLLGQSIYSMLK